MNKWKSKSTKSLIGADSLRRLSSSNKYKAIKTEIDGIKFDSLKEGRRYGELKLLERAHAIKELQVHVRFSLDVNGYHICNYTPDFTYLENGLLVVEDVKSTATKTRDYLLRKKLMMAIHGIAVREV